MPSVASSQPPGTPSKSGIVETADGERRIPASTRPDGSVRKEIKVRPGYRPPEDVEVYRNRQSQSRAKAGVPGAAFVPLDKPRKPPSHRPRPSEALDSAKDAATPSSEQRGSLTSPATTLQKELEPVDPELEKQKEARKLSKKLRQAKDLQQKKDEGESLLPEQFQKVCQISELVRQLDKLGFDREGQKKTTTSNTQEHTASGD